MVGTIWWASTGLIIFTFLQLAGIAVLLESLLFATGIHSHWKRLASYAWHLITLFSLGTFVGVLLFDLPGVFILKAWDYPVYSPLTNLSGYLKIMWGWGAYFLIFHESYLLLDRLLHHRHHHATATGKLKRVYSFLGPIGIALVIAGAAFPILAGTPALSGLMMAGGIWLILEGFEFPRKRSTFLYEVISGNMRPLVSIFIGAMVVGFLSEWTNLVAPTQQWIYYGIPWEKVTLLGVPLSLLLSWSVMYIIFLSLENILVRTDEEIWN